MSAALGPSYLVHAEAARACALLPEDVGFDLVYLDPPYGVGVEMAARTKKGEARGRRGKASGPVAYDDGASADRLVAMIAQSAAAIRERMRPRALFCLHMDHRAVHEAKVAMDRVFGRGAFAGEVIWAPGNGARGGGISMTHQTLLFYARRPAEKKAIRWSSNHPELREPYAATSLAMHFRNVDAHGRAYRERTIAGRTYRYYADEGRRLGSVWSDISAMVANTPLRAEGTGYPTQKPERLLERIILAATEAGDTVADLMCGSGTTLVAAHKLARRFVGGDRSPVALETTERRLRERAIPFEILSRTE